MGKSTGMHVQGWAEHADVATITEWMMQQGQEVQSVSALVGQAFEMLANIIVENGGRAVMEFEEQREAINRIGRQRVRGGGARGTGQGLSMGHAHTRSVQSTQALVSGTDVRMALEHHRRTKGTSVGSEASDVGGGEYDARIARAQVREDARRMRGE